MSTPVVLSTLLDYYKTLVEGVSSDARIYTRKVAYKDDNDFDTKFRIADKSKYLGVEIYRSAFSTIFTAFNRARDTHVFNIRVITGVSEDSDVIAYNDLQDLLILIRTEINSNLTADGNVTDIEFATLGEIDFDTATGVVFWAGILTWMIFDDYTVTNIS